MQDDNNGSQTILIYMDISKDVCMQNNNTKEVMILTKKTKAQEDAPESLRQRSSHSGVESDDEEYDHDGFGWMDELNH